eukprot:8155726-Pyramimonas_sp.AAC.1
MQYISHRTQHRKALLARYVPTVGGSCRRPIQCIEIVHVHVCALRLKPNATQHSPQNAPALNWEEASMEPTIFIWLDA